MTVITLERSSALTKDDGLTTIRGHEFIEELTRQVNQNTPATGTGSPEGVLTAAVGKFYIDDAGGPGTVLYVKQSGTGNTGWILV